MMKRVPVFTSLAISSNDVLSDLCEHIVRTLTCTLVCAQEAEADLPPELVGQVLRLQRAAQTRRRQDRAREVPQDHRLPRQGRAAGTCGVWRMRVSAGFCCRQHWLLQQYFVVYYIFSATFRISHSVFRNLVLIKYYTNTYASKNKTKIH